MNGAEVNLIVASQNRITRLMSQNLESEQCSMGVYTNE